jgi:glutamate dehydrogenase
MRRDEGQWTPERLQGALGRAPENLRWLLANVPSLSTGPMREDEEAIVALATGLGRVARDRQLVLADRQSELVVARLDVPGSIFDTLQHLPGRRISCAETSRSRASVPGSDMLLEIQRYEFDRKSEEQISGAGDAAIPEPIRRAVDAALSELDPPVARREADEILRLLWLNNERFVRLAPPRQVAQLLWLFRQGEAHAGIFLHAEDEGEPGAEEVHLLLAVGNPPQHSFLSQVMEVLNALDVGVCRSIVFTISTGAHPYFLGSFHVQHRGNASLAPGSELLRRVRRQLFSTLILAVESPAYRDFVLPGIMTGEEAALVNAFIGFCHTSLAHSQPHRYTLEDVIRAFHFDPEMALSLVRLFELRFDPDVREREARWPAELARVEQEIEGYNTGHRMLDEFRRSIFQATLTFVRRTLKTNFFVPEKNALAFRLDPAYLADLGPEVTADLPPERPFRVTFFFERSALGYHVGFSDIARGGWRTIFTQSRDDYVTVANTVFRETYVLAHTQHLKNKDIYEGGSKMVVVLRSSDLRKEWLNQRLYKVQHGFASAFLDVFVTEGGKAKDPRVVDYYGEDEPIELGPDENMHDAMIEAIAALSARRGYLLGTGIMSSKRVGINHKRYGVTSTGVVTFAEIAMRERGVDIRGDRFTVKFTGGPNGDVAGNAIRILLDRCPRVEIRLIVDGTGALYDPRGLDRGALSDIVLRADADAFDPARLSAGGVLLYRSARRTEGLRELYRRVEMTEGGLEERWITLDEFHKEYDELPFEVAADLFIPAGGRPETIDATNWRRFLGEDGRPTAGVIVEGANSFLTPEARKHLQAVGAVVLRDASANKCGVISSSYEIIGNLLLGEEEFLQHKEAYVRDVLEILRSRAADEAELIFRRRREEEGRRSFTEISEALSLEINAHKARLFRFFESRPDLWERQIYRRALLAHLPRLVRESPAYQGRVSRLPGKYRSAILAAEIATAMVYRRPLVPDFARELEEYVTAVYA